MKITVLMKMRVVGVPTGLHPTKMRMSPLINSTVIRLGHEMM